MSTTPMFTQYLKAKIKVILNAHLAPHTVNQLMQKIDDAVTPVCVNVRTEWDSGLNVAEVNTGLTARLNVIVQDFDIGATVLYPAKPQADVLMRPLLSGFTTGFVAYSPDVTYLGDMAEVRRSTEEVILVLCIHEATVKKIITDTHRALNVAITCDAKINQGRHLVFEDPQIERNPDYINSLIRAFTEKALNEIGVMSDEFVAGNAI